MPETIVVAGGLSRQAGKGGLTWVYLQYLLGFRRLGWDVVFVDWLDSGEWFDEHGFPCEPRRSVNASYLASVMRRMGLGESFALFDERMESVAGLERRDVLARLKRAPFLLNVMGYLKDEEILAKVQTRLFLDIDPGFGQMWKQLGLADIFTGHDVYVTIGENIGTLGCDVPTCGLEWITTPQPVVLDEWPKVDAGGDALTSVGSWRGTFGPIEYRGRSYGLRVHEFRRFVELPQLVPAPFEVALDIDSVETRDLDTLQACGWSLVDPAVVAGDPVAYREYVQGSKAEFMVAKNMYVETRSGWFSDRSMCYLASGKPVLAQDTGLGDIYPTGEGLLTFSTLDEAVAGVEAICGNYQRHCRAAREIAEEYFDSDRVLKRLLEKLGAA